MFLAKRSPIILTEIDVVVDSAEVVSEMSVVVGVEGGDVGFVDGLIVVVCVIGVGLVVDGFPAKAYLENVIR